MKLFYFLIIVSISCGGQELAKPDSLKLWDLDEVVVTATRSERQMGALPMPVSVVSKKQIQQMGSMRLNDVLNEQTGLFIVNDHGNGVQVQGFSPDYTLILVDGEPLVGRTAGTLELSRLAVGNIKQIEIVKGPSSSLYGSEALAGVINIITEDPTKPAASFSARYGTNNALDLGSNLAYRKNKVGLSLFANRFSSSGYDLSPETFGQTVSPFVNFTIQPKLKVNFSDNTNLTVSSRYFNETQSNAFDLGKGGTVNAVSGNGYVNDFSINPSLNHRFNDKFKFTTRFYITRYTTNSTLKYESDGELYDETFFTQNFARPELQADIILNEKNLLTTGVGMVAESVEATRYEEQKRFNTKYIFAQYEYFPSDKLHFILGGRYDAHSAFRNQLSPKLSGSYLLTPKVMLRASAGVGYKAPDFRQLYLNFSNAVAGYNVFGSQEIRENLARLQAENQIIDVLANIDSFGELRPESSRALNIGVKFDDSKGFISSINFFRNDIQDLIETQAVARKTNGQNVFSYQNISEVLTQGFETEISKIIRSGTSTLQFSGGYQYLEAKDKSVLTKLENGNVFRRDANLATERVPKKDYGGLMGRSRHSANVKVFYENRKLVNASLRGIYRGRYGFGDLNANTILDADNEYVQGFVTWNFSITKNIKKLDFQAGIDNLLNFQDTQFIPSIPGRLWWVKTQVNF